IRVRAKEHSEALVDQLNKNSVENSDLNAQLQEKVFVTTTLKNDLRKLKRKDTVDNAAPSSNATTIALGIYKLDLVILAPRDKMNRGTHIYYLKHTMEQAAILREIVKQAKSLNPLDSASYTACKYVNLIQELLGYVRDTHLDIHKPSEKLVTVTPMNEVKKVRFSKPLTSLNNIKQVESSKISDFNTHVLSSTGVKCSTSTCRSQPTGKKKNDMILQPSSSNIKNKVEPQPRKVNKKNHVVEPICDAIKHTCYVCNLEGVYLLSGSRETNLYTLSIGDMMAFSLICLLSKASKTTSWLWHRCLSYLNVDAINHLVRHGLVRDLPKLKFEKDHLCPACGMRKRKKQSHKTKSEDTNLEKLYLLHMDLYGPMRVASVNGKKYIVVIVDDYSRFIWVKFPASKDEALDFIIKFMKMIQVRLNATVRNIRIDNISEFVNQTLHSYYGSVGIFYETSVVRTSQQNGVVERRNRTLIEAARTMLIYAKALLFLWDEAVATLCYI
nr:retrovirus-related Pol polyprotein from transposon TNT 1-94 [Tanacetum cinerariifolium]